MNLFGLQGDHKTSQEFDLAMVIFFAYFMFNLNIAKNTLFKTQLM